MLPAFALAALLVAGGAGECAAQADEAQAAEYRVKAAFLYKFGSFVEWPPDAFARPEIPFVIGVIGADELADELAQVVAGRSVSGHPITVRKLRRGSSLAGLQVLFIGRADGGRLAEILAPAKGQPMLTVTESEGALAHGSVINFVVVGDKVRFDVALPPAELGNLKISARLLAVARRVIAGPT